MTAVVQESSTICDDEVAGNSLSDELRRVCELKELFSQRQDAQVGHPNPLLLLVFYADTLRIDHQQCHRCAAPDTPGQHCKQGLTEDCAYCPHHNTQQCPSQVSSLRFRGHILQAYDTVTKHTHNARRASLVTIESS